MITHSLTHTRNITYGGGDALRLYFFFLFPSSASVMLLLGNRRKSGVSICARGLSSHVTALRVSQYLNGDDDAPRDLVVLLSCAMKQNLIRRGRRICLVLFVVYGVKTPPPPTDRLPPFHGQERFTSVYFHQDHTDHPPTSLGVYPDDGGCSRTPPLPTANHSR